jgi:hypothetical protein
METLNTHGREQLIILIDQATKLRKNAWLSFSPKRIFHYYIDLSHRKRCLDCRVLYTKHLAKLAGIEL